MLPLGRFFRIGMVIWHICLSSTSKAHVTENQDDRPTCEGSMTYHDEEVDVEFDSELGSEVGIKLYTPICSDLAIPTTTTGASVGTPDVESGIQTVAIPPTQIVHVTHITILTSDVSEPVTTKAMIKATPVHTPRVTVFATVRLPKRRTAGISPREGYIRLLTRDQIATIPVTTPGWDIVE
ncbi:hypothetical protein N3K66_007183 [Trichothecium roseum]|uniref:Uncharacterized protein n=1 Tax=Trichothecium roseum TaxID=47278 RepID=A0ACC0UUY7_9HYPO|nr:hypothetical protein N3K66_007183 [Trichothecium roseum]